MQRNRAKRTQASGTAERSAALDLIGAMPSWRRITVGADKGYDTVDFVAEIRALKAAPHVAQNISGRRSRIDARTTRHSGYEVNACRGCSRAGDGLRDLRPALSLTG